jgi:hypothetical protein
LLDEPEHRPHGGGLPGPVRPEETGQPAGPDRERAPVQGGHRTEPLRHPVEDARAGDQLDPDETAAGLLESYEHHIACGACDHDAARATRSAGTRGRPWSGRGAGSPRRSCTWTGPGAPGGTCPATSRPDRQTVYGYFAAWRDDGTLARLHDVLRELVRASAGRNAEPTAAETGSQSVRAADTVPKASRGWDNAKKDGGVVDLSH